MLVAWPIPSPIVYIWKSARLDQEQPTSYFLTTTHTSWRTKRRELDQPTNCYESINLHILTCVSRLSDNSKFQILEHRPSTFLRFLRDASSSPFLASPINQTNLHVFRIHSGPALLSIPRLRLQRHSEVRRTGVAETTYTVPKKTSQWHKGFK
jgi:hypothetical protein